VGFSTNGITFANNFIIFREILYLKAAVFMKVVVKNIINSTIAAFHNDGLLVFKCLDQAIQKREQVELSFDGIDRCATQFLNAAIGKLYVQYDPKLVDSLLHYDYSSVSNLEAKIAEVRENAIHSNEYDSLINNATA
jgi:hypothetical protein